MTYEEKLSTLKRGSTIDWFEIVPIDYFKLIRDKGIKQIEYKKTNGTKDTYEIHCIPIYSWCSNVNAVIDVEQYTDLNSINTFMNTLLSDTQFILLEGRIYKIELDPMETYE